MTKNPFINAGAALAYIVAVVHIMTYATTHTAQDSHSIVIPVTVLSLFTLSVAVMGYIFVFQPIRMYLDGDKKGGIQLFLRTIGIFACITAILLGVLTWTIPS